MRACINESVREIMEELQGSSPAPQQPGMPTPGQQPVKPVPQKGKVAGNPAQQVAAGVQATAQQAAQGAAAAGDAKLQQQIAQQQGQTPQQAAATNKTAAAQPQPTRVNPTAMARDQRNDAVVNRKQAQTGKVVAAEDFNELDKLLVEDEITKQAGDDAANPDDKDGFNDNEAAKRAKERMKEISAKAPGEKPDFPGEKVKPKAAGYGEEGAGRPQGHHEVTHPGQRIPRSTEKDVKEAETVYTDAERSAMLDKVFG
jgi:hypothetical protein